MVERKVESSEMDGAAVTVGSGSVVILDIGKEEDAGRVRYLRLVARSLGRVAPVTLKNTVTTAASMQRRKV